jgi:hypothetical protein
VSENEGETVGAQWTRVPKLAVTLLRQMQHKLSAAVGRPLTEYRFRPGADGRPVWVCYTDASRNVDTFFGASGGYFHLWDSDWVFFLGGFTRSLSALVHFTLFACTQVLEWIVSCTSFM